jgi:hypothetical protein
VGEKSVGEKPVGEKHMGEKSVGEKYMVEPSVGEKYMGEKYMGERLWVKSLWVKSLWVKNLWGKIGVDGMLAFVPPFSGTFTNHYASITSFIIHHPSTSFIFISSLASSFDLLPPAFLSAQTVV